MSQINNITVNLALNTLPITQKGFGIPLVCGTKVRAGKPAYVEVTDADQLLDTAIGFVQADEEYKKVQTIFSQSPRVEKVSVCGISAYAALATEIAAFRNAGKDDWYYFLICSKSKADIALAEDYINSLTKMGFYSTGDKTITSSKERSVIIITNKTTEHPDAAILGRLAGLQIGKYSWDSKQLNGITNSGVTMSEQTSLLAANFNLIREMGGVDVFWEGKTMSGQYIDSVVSRDYLTARFIEAIQNLKINNLKVPFDQRGIAMTEASLRSVFDDAGLNEVIRPVISEPDRKHSDIGKYQYKVFMPESVDAISEANRLNRIIAPIELECKLSGSINTFKISGSLAV